MRKRRITDWLNVFAGTAAALLCGRAGALEWQEVAPGMQVAETTFQHRTSVRSVAVLAVKFDPRRFGVEVLDLAARSTASGKADQHPLAIASLREVAADSRWVAGINGAYVTSYAFPRPAGMLRVRGVAVTRMNGNKPFSGVVCLSRDGRAEILQTTTDPGSRCSSALESGPVLVEGQGKNGIRSSEPAKRVYERSVVCVDTSGWLVLVRAGPTALYDLAEFLRRKGAEGGVECTTAINLSGDADSGMFWRVGSALKYAGSTDAALATAIAIRRR